VGRVLLFVVFNNIADVVGREQAISEAVRILKRGGILLNGDLAHVDDEYAPRLGEAGSEATTLGRVRGSIPPQRLLLGTLPHARMSARRRQREIAAPKLLNQRFVGTARGARSGPGGR